MTRIATGALGTNQRMNKETFCSLPFNEIFLGPDGGIKTCCSASESIGSLHEDNIETILQSDVARGIRQSVINGQWHPACVQCQRQEAQGARSERKSEMEEFVAEHGLPDQSTFKLKRLDLRWSNTCNLSCTYCYEYFSSKWAQLKGIKVNTIKDENENSLFLLIEQHKPTINSILMLGGEPMLQKQNARLIETLTDRSFYMLSNLAVPVQTNKVGQLLIKERLSQIGVSFENVGDRYEYVRHGASWKVFDDNIKYIHERRPEKFQRIEAHSLYSIYSAFNLVEFYEYILENKFQDLFWNLLESSGESEFASVLNLSPELREKAVKEIENVERQFSDAPGLDWLRSFKSPLLADNEKNHNSKFITEFDKLENTYLTDKTSMFKDLWPEVHSLLIK
jgi:organic radical activating enzyme